MKKIKIFSLMMCIVLLLSFCGCGSDQSAKIISEDDLIGEDGCFLYTVVSAEENTTIPEADRETNNLKKQLAEAFDIKVNSVNDKKIKADSNNYEILIGNTNRPESKKAYEILKSNREQNIDDWMIKVIDRKICIVTIDDKNLAKAIRYFNVNYCTKLSDFAKACDGLQYIDMKSYEITDVRDVKIAGNKISEYSIVMPREKSLIYTLKVSSFVEIFEEKYGIGIKQLRDTETKESQYEIVIGDTNRSVSAQNDPQGDTYILAVVGDKLVINGGNDVAIAHAMQKLLDSESQCRKADKPFQISKDYKEEGTVSSDEKEYYIAWADEFNNGLDKRVWADPVGGESADPSPNGGTTYNRGNKNAFVRDGNLVLPSKRLNTTDFESSAVQTRNALAYRYGILEVRAKLAPPPMCSTIWGSKPNFQIKNGVRRVLPEIKNRMELDVLENYGQPDWFASNVHHWWADGSTHSALDGSKYSEQKKYTFPEGEAFYDDFHIFSYEWTPYGFVFAVDGEVYFKYDISTLDNVGYAQTPIDIRLSGGYSNAGYYLQKKIPDDAPEYGEYQIDYVRVYQNEKYDNILWFSPADK